MFRREIRVLSSVKFELFLDLNLWFSVVLSLFVCGYADLGKLGF